MVDISEARLEAIMATAEPVRLIPSGLLASLRQLDAQMAAIRAQQRAMVDGYLAGAEIDMAANSVDINLDSGIVTVTPLPPKE